MMRALAILVLMAAVAGCARWQPQSQGSVALARACPLARAPAVTDFGKAGVRGVYHFVIDGAGKEDIRRFLDASKAGGLRVMLVTVTINGKDTLFVAGPQLLRTQSQVDRAFDSACALGHGKVFLTHARYDPPDPNSDYIRAR